MKPYPFTSRPWTPDDDLRALWIATHDYLVCQAATTEGDPALSQAYTNLVHVHNLMHARYFAEDDKGEEIAG